MTVPKKILILGGYGKAGRQIAFLLAKHTSYAILIAGRNFSKAEDYTKELLAQFPERQIEAVGADADEPDEMIRITMGINLMIVCIPLRKESTLNLIKAILKSNYAHCLDLSPGREKHDAFAEAASEIKENRKLFILDTGFNPGLPGFLSHMAASLIESPEELEIEAVYKDPDIGESGIIDILSHEQTPLIYKQNHWKEVSIFRVKAIDFPRPFGKTLAVPAFLPELKELPGIYGLEKLEMFHAGINSLSNMVLVLWKSSLSRIFPLKFGISLFDWTVRRFSGPPFGGIIRVSAKGLENQVEVSICHGDLYEATAIPVVATAIQILENPVNPGGKYFMGSWVEKKSFLLKIREMGLTVGVH